MFLRKGLPSIIALAFLFFAGWAAGGADVNAVCPGDFDDNGKVDLADFLAFAEVYGTSSSDASYNARMDMDGSGRVELSDFLAFAEVFGTTCPTPVPQRVSIPDDSLRAAIAEALGKPRDAPITSAEMATLTSLRVRYMMVRDLTGLEFATELTFLDLAENNITDISALKSLTNLTGLDLASNKIADVSALAGLERLELLLLGANTITDISALGGLNRLKHLSLAYNNEVMDISPLERLTNLTRLDLASNRIVDVSSLAGLNRLARLSVRHNAVTDISVLAGLSNLTSLDLAKNNITDISALKSLVNLTFLDLAVNHISDISVLAGVKSLETLSLMFNAITDIGALIGLPNLKYVDLRGNSLTLSSIDDPVSGLRNSGVVVSFDTLRRNDFDIELVFLDHFTEKQKDILLYAARRWMSIIEKDLPDYVSNVGWTNKCYGHQYEIASGERIDDVRIYVAAIESGPAGYGGPHLVREVTHLPVTGCMAFNLKSPNFLLFTGLHEMGHVLGFGTVWDDLGFLQDFSRDDPNADPHFNGPLSITAFDEASGQAYRGAKVPVQKFYGAHWRYGILEGELMTPGGGKALSAITIQSLADLGYGVDATQADDYTLPGTTASAKIAVAAPPVPGFRVDVGSVDVGTRYGVRADGQGRIEGVPPAILRDDARTGRLEDAERIWGRGMTFDLADNRQMWGAGSPAHAEPELRCGAGLRRGPIYVVDQQGIIIRTIGD